MFLDFRRNFHFTDERSGFCSTDLKPTNLFLPGDDVARCKLLDFGIARPMTAGTMTGTGIVVGTPGYMAPEQARGVRDLTPATDIFSLGCVLYECLSGEPPFAGEHIVAVLARILFEAPAPIAARRPGIPAALVSLLDDMLNKDAELRIADAQALLDRLTALGEVPESPVTQAAVIPPALAFAENEQLLFSLVVAAPPPCDPSQSVAPLVPQQRLDAASREFLLSAVRMMGARAEYLLNGTLMATVLQTGSAQDQVAMAARVALLIKERWSAATVALTTGRGNVHGGTVVGELSDRALQFLGQSTGDSLGAPTDSGVWLDELSVRLLDPRFAITRRGQATLLTREEKEVDASRPLLGRPTPCVGRDAELGSLESQLTSCIAESEARVVLVSALPGVGKSRLRHEFLRRVERGSDAVTVLLGRGDMMSAGSPYGILGDAIRRLCRLSEGAPLAEQRLQLRDRIAQHIAPAEQQRVVLFVGELCKIPFPDEGAPVLQAARQDPKVMRDCLQRAVLDWLRAECAVAPVLLVLDDLHWGDAVTVALLDEALQVLRGLPLLVLAFARPEVHQVFPDLWKDRKLQQIALRALSKKACERLIQQVLGKNVPAEAMTRAVEQSAGNALFLEELIRAIADGNWTAQNATVMAMLQARLGRLDSNVRRAVRAAAVFGQTFWWGGVAAILGVSPLATESKSWIAALVEAELVQKQVASRINGNAEYSFRHALVRDAVYDLLTPDDLRTGHCIAGKFLEAAGEPDAGMIAEHFERGGDRPRAAKFYEQAAERALSCYDWAGALDKARRGIACGAEGESRGRLLGIQCITQVWSQSWSAAVASGEAALPLLPPQSRRWIDTASSLLFMINAGPGPATLTLMQPGEIVAALLQTPATADTLAPLAEAAALLCSSAEGTGLHQLLDISYARLVALGAQTSADDLVVQRWVSWGTVEYSFFRRAAPWSCYTAAQRSAQQFRQVGNHLHRTMMEVGVSFLSSELGELAAAESALTAAWLKFRDSADYMFRGLAGGYLGMLLFRTLRPEEESRMQVARTLVEDLTDGKSVLPGASGIGYVVMAKILSCEGRLDQCFEAAWRGYELLQKVVGSRRMAASGLLRLLVEHGRLVEAQTFAVQELDALTASGGTGFFELPVRSECVNALYLSGESARALTELQVSLQRIGVRVADLPDPERRLTYLTHNLDCVLIRQLAVSLLGTDPLADLLTAT